MLREEQARHLARPSSSSIGLEKFTVDMAPQVIDPFKQYSRTVRQSIIQGRNYERLEAAQMRDYVLRSEQPDVRAKVEDLNR